MEYIRGFKPPSVLQKLAESFKDMQNMGFKPFCVCGKVKRSQLQHYWAFLQPKRRSMIEYLVVGSVGTLERESTNYNWLYKECVIPTDVGTCASTGGKENKPPNKMFLFVCG